MRPLLLCLALTACAPADDTAQQMPIDTATMAEPSALPPRSKEEQDSARENFVKNGLLLDISSVDKVVAVLGEPLNRTVTPVQNRHDPAQTDTSVLYHFQGVKVSSYRMPANEIISAVQVTDTRHVRAPIRVGMAWDDVVKLLGEPNFTEDADPAYTCVTCEVDDPVFFRLENGRVAEIRFTKYLD